MRPLELTITGLRSHRGTTTVTFPDDWQLAAIVGLTGAGKSSLLEAIVYALFGSGTVFGASQPTNLISDDAREMRVLFGFALGAERFEITRTYRRGGGNIPPVLKTPARMVSGAKEVEVAIARLLGLHQDAFCSTVLLPQGRFAKLLQAAAGDQKEVLDAFFRLGDVTETSSRLVAAANRLAGRKQELEMVRAQLPPDPAGEVRQVQRRVREAERRRDAATELLKIVAGHRARATDAAARAESARRRGEELMKIAGALGDVGVRAAALDAVATELASAEVELDARRDAAATEVRVASEALTALDAPGVEVAAARVDAFSTRLAEAVTARKELGSAAATAKAAGAELEHARVEHDQRAERRRSACEAHERARTGADEASERLGHLRELADELRRRSAEVDAVERRRAGAANDFELARVAEEEARRQSTDAVAAVATAEAKATVARGALGEATTASESASSRAERVDRLRVEAANRRSERDQLGVALASRREGLAASRAAAERAAQAASELENRWRHARAEAQAFRRGDAAAVAAAGCTAGDPCPICARKLPRGFAPPAPSAHTRDAEVAEKAAEDELQARRDDAARTAADLDLGVREEASAAQRLAGAQHLLAEAERALAPDDSGDAAAVVAAAASARAVLERARLDDQRASTELAQARARRDAVASNVEPLAAAAKRAATVLAAATTERDRAATAAEGVILEFATAGGEAAVMQGEKDVAALTDALAASKRALEMAETAASEAEKRRAAAEQRAAASSAHAEGAATRSRQVEKAVRAAVAAIPAEARRGAGDDPAEVADAASRWIGERRRLVAEAQRRRTDAERVFDDARREIEDLRTRRSASLDRRLAAATSDGIRLATSADASLPVASPSAGVLALWAVTACRDVERAARARHDDAATADAEAGEATKAARTACVDAGVEPDGLERWHADAQAEVGAAEESLRAARDVAARARELDAVLEASAERTRLLVLARDLSQGKESFANHVLVARRQGLVAEAAAVLAELSNGRLTFAEDAAATFTVLDTATGTARDPRLLSGGEQFQASLALALALVEIAARAGSRIECLFLDEGFAALDPASLDIALDALEAAARRGRRIVAVTHVDAVTARADQVLGVAGSESGSRVSWRTAGALAAS
jgi:exonuclease SbcC